MVKKIIFLALISQISVTMEKNQTIETTDQNTFLRGVCVGMVETYIRVADSSVKFSALFEKMFIKIKKTGFENDTKTMDRAIKELKTAQRVHAVTNQEIENVVAYLKLTTCYRKR